MCKEKQLTDIIVISLTVGHKLKDTLGNQNLDNILFKNLQKANNRNYFHNLSLKMMNTMKITGFVWYIGSIIGYINNCMYGHISQTVAEIAKYYQNTL